MDAEGLENALANAKLEVGSEKLEAKTEKVPEMSVQEEIGFHKGAVNTLVNERNELVKMVRNVEVVLNAHVKRLKELGVSS